MYLIFIMYYNIIYFLYYAILGVTHDECISGIMSH